MHICNNNTFIVVPHAVHTSIYKINACLPCMQCMQSHACIQLHLVPLAPVYKLFTVHVQIPFELISTLTCLPMYVRMYTQYINVAWALSDMNNSTSCICFSIIVSVHLQRIGQLFIKRELLTIGYGNAIMYYNTMVMAIYVTMLQGGWYAPHGH